MVIKVLLLVITLGCVYVIVCIGLKILPTIGQISNATQVNNVLLNLSYSYIAGLIFYLLVSYYPFYRQKRKFASIIAVKKDDLLKQIEACIQTFEEEDKKGLINNISKEELISLINKKDMYENSFYAKEVGYSMDNLLFLVKTRSNCFDIIDKLIVYKEYLRDVDIYDLEKIRDSAFFIYNRLRGKHPVNPVLF